MTETDENLYKRFEKIINEHSGWRLKLRWFFHPSRKKLCKEMEKSIHRGEAVAIRCSEETERKLYDYYVRKLLKPRVHRIKIDTWEE